ncbi:MAG: prepilin-type N-terminal cleavage/methylation domain-containing protein [Armatimonadetes bacterium]|nr:prepilin-type N-terminal cleavage/methylation domain-containing protein [Armatimonadota bacterium]
MRRAFTLIELLVVIAIIAILAAILFPVFAAAKESAKATAGLAQMRQLSMGVMIYTSDNDETFVPSTNYDTPTADPTRIWTTNVYPYVKDRQIFIAPGAQGSEFATDWSTRHRQSIGYNDTTAFAFSQATTADLVCTNGQLVLGCSAYTSAANTSQMEEPAGTGMFANTPHGAGGKYRGFVFGADNGTTFKPGFTTLTDLKQAVPLASGEDLVAKLGGAPSNLSPGALKPIIGRYLRQGSDGRTPVVFADGHTKSYKASAIQSGASGIIWRFR